MSYVLYHTIELLKRRSQLKTSQNENKDFSRTKCKSQEMHFLRNKSKRNFSEKKVKEHQGTLFDFATFRTFQSFRIFFFIVLTLDPECTRRVFRLNNMCPLHSMLYAGEVHLLWTF